MTRNSLSFLLLALLVAPGCRGTLTLFGVEPLGDDDDIVGDDDDVADDDDTVADDDDSVADDDDSVGDDDDSVEPGECASAWTLNCGEGAVDSWNNGADDGTNGVLEYSCLPNQEWTGPEYTYTFVAEESGSHTIRLFDFEGDLDLFAVAPGPGGVCSGDNCFEFSGNPPDTAEEMTVELAEGQEVYLVIDGWQGTVSDYSIRVECPGVVGDDDDDDDDDDACNSPVLARPHQQNNAAVWLNTGNGWASQSGLNPSGQGTVWGVAVADFDGDGAIDVITERQSNQGIEAVLFANDCATSQFTETNVTGFSFAGLDDLHGVGDLDQDGDIDVIGIEWNTGVGRTWLNDGSGTGWTAVPSAFDLDSWDTDDGGTHESVGFPAVDVTGDFLPDLVECSNQLSSPTSCTIHEGVGDGTFLEGSSFTLDRLANSVAAADFNGDGAVDYVGGLDDDGDAGQVWIWLGNPLAPTSLPSGPGIEAFDVQGGGNNQNNAPGYGWLFPADADDDGDVDVFVTVMDPFGGEDHEMYLAENNGLGIFTVSPIDDSSSAWSSDDALIQSTLGVPVRPGPSIGPPPGP